MLDEKIDVKENNILNTDYGLLAILLKDNTTKKNIIWATDNYISYGASYSFENEIKIEQITGNHGMLIKPRIKKSNTEQAKRIKEKAEVFTPLWICNKQNNLIDESWFGYKNIFNKEIEHSWKTLKRRVKFIDGKTWEEYVALLRMELSCGEAPYLVSRYDPVSGDALDVVNRIGLLDRKIRIVNENIDDELRWNEWVIKAFKSIYGYEWQGDNVLIARENLLYTYIDNYIYKFNKYPSRNQLKVIAEIISWNIWQMDGIKYVIPNSCRNEKTTLLTLFGEEKMGKECIGCQKKLHNKHNGKYCKIMNWETGKKIKFVSLVGRSKR